MRIAIGCDANALELKEYLIAGYGDDERYAFVGCGVSPDEAEDYPDVALRVAALVTSGECEKGVLLCGTGIGMAISANKVTGIYAAVCHDLYSTQRSILSNDCNVLCMGALVVGKQTARMLLDIWLGLHYVDGPSTRKIEKVKKIEHRGG